MCTAILRCVLDDILPVAHDVNKWLRHQNFSQIYLQIRILGEPSTDDGVPSFEEIFRDDDDAEDDDDVDDNDENSDKENGETENRTDRIERDIIKRREMRQWEEKRNKIMFDYTQYSYYGRSSALTIFELAWKLSRDSMELLWWAIVGLTEQLVLEKIESTAYVLESDKIQSHVSRLANKASDQTLQTSIKIHFENDLRIALYRHWSVQDSIKHSKYSACRLKLWTLRGEKKLHELLVEMGLPLAQARQQFSSMDMLLRQEFYQMIEKSAVKYNLDDIVYGSFTLQYGYRNKYSAADFVYATIAILESVKKDRTPERCFLEALDSLTRANKEMLDAGIEQAKQFLYAVYRQVQISLTSHQVHSAGPFLYFVLTEENSFFSCPYGLAMLAKFMLEGYVSIARNRRAHELPLIACAPIDLDIGMYLVIGVPPVCEASPKNFFGKAFEQAAHKSNILISLDFFESSIIQIKQSDLTKFLDGLTVLLR